MGGLIGGIFIFVVFCLFILYYFTCYANTSVRKKDEAFMTSSSYIDVDTLRKNHLLSEQSIGRVFDEGSVSGFSDSDSEEEEEEGGETRHEVMGNRLRHNLAGSNDNIIVNGDDDEMIKAWNVDLVDYQNANTEVLHRNRSSFGSPVGEESSDDDNESRTEKNTYTKDNSNSEYLSNSRHSGMRNGNRSRSRSRSGSGGSSYNSQGDFFDNETFHSDAYDSEDGSQDDHRRSDASRSDVSRSDVSRSDVDYDDRSRSVVSHNDVYYDDRSRSHSDEYHSDSEGNEDIDDSPYRERLDT
jgi:hypothetical protein